MKEINHALVSHVLVYVCCCMHIHISVSSVVFGSALVRVSACVSLTVFVHSKTCGESSLL